MKIKNCTFENFSVKSSFLINFIDSYFLVEDSLFENIILNLNGLIYLELLNEEKSSANVAKIISSIFRKNQQTFEQNSILKQNNFIHIISKKLDLLISHSYISENRIGKK